MSKNPKSLKVLIEKLKDHEIDSKEFSKETQAISKEMELVSKKENDLFAERDKIVREYSTGYVWVYYQLPNEN